jgi:hypothetical protein
MVLLFVGSLIRSESRGVSRAVVGGGCTECDTERLRRLFAAKVFWRFCANAKLQNSRLHLFHLLAALSIRHKSFTKPTGVLVEDILCSKCETCYEDAVACAVLGTHPATLKSMRPSFLVLFVPSLIIGGVFSLTARSNHVHLERRRATSCVLGISIRAVPCTK